MNRTRNIFLASSNRDKVEELRKILAPLGFELTSASEIPDAPEVEEDQPDLKGNALKKARFWHQKTGLTSLADDTGLEVDALDGAPGVRSARYAGEQAGYRDNLEKLLKVMVGVKDRSARFRTVIAMVGELAGSPDESSEKGELIFEGVCEGFITDSPSGEKGFGYDPIFRPEGYEETFAKLDPEVKNRISHRAKALEEVVRYLKQRQAGEK